MKNLLLKLLLCLTFFTGYSQEIESKYRFKKVKKVTFRNTKISSTDSKLDSLVLYKNGDFYRQTSYSQIGNFGFEEQKGQWIIDNGILYLNITAKKEWFENQNWKGYNGEIKYSIKRKKLIPINGNFGIFGKRNLKLIQ
jgi:hypothetical protein